MRLFPTTVLLAFSLASALSFAEKPPNLVLIMADDMGYGDVRVLNAQSGIPTPNLDRLAREGMTFTDAHSPSAVCTPTRYGVITGRYCWRSRLKRGVLGGYSAPLIEKDRPTVGSVLQAAGYHTAAIGKWHLGMTMPQRKGRKVNNRWDGDGNVDFKGKINDSPVTRGFNEYFGVSASLDMAPYVWIENDHFTKAPTIQYPGSGFPVFIRKGPQADDLKFEEALDVLAERAVGFLGRMAKPKKKTPFFLYLPLTGPHKPVVPHPRFQGKTKLGPYGDFVMNVDDCVGQVLKALDELGLSQGTLVIFTSDNGSFMYSKKSDDDHLSDATIQSYDPAHHRANGALRGTKADVWEAGHRVPFLARWPGQVKAGSKTAKTICHVDLLATAAEVAGAKIPSGAAADSYSFLPLLTGKEDNHQRPPVINHSAGGMFAIRDGKWKLVLGNGSGGRQAPKGKPFQRPYHLFDLEADLSEANNLVGKENKVAQRLEKLFLPIHQKEEN